MIFLSYLAEEAVVFPELILLPLIEWMIMALGALNLETEEETCRHCCQLHAIVLILHLSQRIVDRTIFFVMAGCRNNINDDLIPWTILGKSFTVELLHSRATDPARRPSADAVIRPDRRKIPNVVFICQ